jgi:outer membrane lipoprotein LolB
MINTKNVDRHEEVAKLYYFGHILCLNPREKQRILTVKQIIWILFLALTLSSCARMSRTETIPAEPSATKADRQASLANIHSWHVNGKIALQASHDSGSANVDWTQNQQQYAISMSGPLGASGMKLTGHPGLVTLQTSDGKTYSAASAEQLLAERWNFHLPVSNMQYWIRGLAVPGMPANTRFDQYGRLESLVQQGWRVDYLAYSNVGKLDLPEKISITSPSLRVKMIIYKWNLG